MKLRELCIEDQLKYQAFVQEWSDVGEIKITPMSANLNGLTFERWLEKLTKDRQKKNNSFVPADTLFLEVDDKLVGAVQLRYELTEGLQKIGGNIGYGIAPSERGKGYASVILQKALLRFGDKGFSSVLLTCDKTNLASQKTIQKNGGCLLAEYSVENKKIQKYQININS
ncbi:GNAT family N-acetyltransferase [Enterococcus sp. DIV0242_7C1]|uniref:N-acetyltransferase domain-containing protein n=1 Tax=Candidatus Enterococcus dunnyi TaxID=1834192 RepID=A0A200J8J4_9ENTE|nr:MULTISPECIES: GNAT family N-acetyltransferase [unclassified Enterococcus]MBO0470700.1 GNAT family N-acetyltransferase [Enterococcus sp. DIV0242_7C1]OUZ33149.1 hypothetical protein A5889_001858 [Enterococcus sp. 9D6_DIV0238]